MDDDDIQPAPISWSEYYITYGNAEIRIKFGENVVYSNFGTGNGYYNALGNDVVDFLGEEAKENKMATFLAY